MKIIFDSDNLYQCHVCHGEVFDIVGQMLPDSQGKPAQALSIACALCHEDLGDQLFLMKHHEKTIHR